MAKRDGIEQGLSRISALKSAEVDATLLAELRVFLRHRSNLLAAKAAKLAGARRLGDLRTELVAAFHRLMADAPHLDKRCEALTEIATALYALDYREPEVYRAGLRHVQMEGSYGPPIDAAAQLRGICAMGLVRTSDPEALAEVVELLMDPEPPARIGAVRALATNGGPAGALLLRLKVLTGDSEPEVLAECFSGLLGVPSASTVAFVARYMDSEEADVAEAAMLALGAARSPHAVAALKGNWERTRRGPLQRILLLALSTSRNEEALQFLVGLLASEPIETAVEILTAVADQRPADSIRASIRIAVELRASDTLAVAHDSAFPTSSV